MKKQIITNILPITSLLLLASCSGLMPPKLSPEVQSQVSRLLPGTWVSEKNQNASNSGLAKLLNPKNNKTSIITRTFKRNGEAISVVKSQRESGSAISIESKGRWEVQGDKLLIKGQKLNLMGVNTTVDTAFIIQNMDARTMTIKTTGRNSRPRTYQKIR